MNLNRVNSLISQLESTIEERQQLISLNLDPSVNDNYDLVNLISLIHGDLLKSTSSSLSKDTISIINRYNDLLKKLTDDKDVSIEEYFVLIPEVKAKEPKSVRFSDINEEADDDDLRNELMGTRSFKPFKDEVNELEVTTTNSSDTSSLNLNNHQLFAQHQQQMLDQDTDLDILHDSVKIQKQMGRNINQEIDDHLILLSDLENGVDSSQRRLNTTANRLNDFRTRVQENGSLVTIVVLTVVLIILLVVLN